MGMIKKEKGKKKQNNLQTAQIEQYWQQDKPLIKS